MVIASSPVSSALVHAKWAGPVWSVSDFQRSTRRSWIEFHWSSSG